MTDERHIYELDNGIRLVHFYVPHTEIVHCGMMINSGSRDENSKNNGVAHFIEHTVFKGTEKRKSHHILKRIESVGGELNAYTTREKTCYYASCLKEYAERAIDLLTDITFNSQFPEKEIQKEKKVILEEIDMYEDSPEESIYDDFYKLLFGSHSLGYNILGTPKTVKNLERENLLQFIENNYTPAGIVLSIAGNITALQAEKYTRKYLENLKLSAVKKSKRKPPQPSETFNVKEEKDFVQAHCIIGNKGYSRFDGKRFTLALINNVLGGSGMSSRMNMAVREKHGLTYHIGTHYSTYDDTGVFTIYFATEEKNLNKCVEIIHRELKKMREVKFTDRQLVEAKKQLLGQMAMVMENNSVHMQHQARNVLDHGKVFRFKDFSEGVERVTAEDIIHVSNEVFASGSMSSLAYIPEKK